jgi:hypothetical protein
MQRTPMPQKLISSEFAMTPTASSQIDTKIAQAQQSADYISSLIATQEAATPPPAVKPHWWTADNALTISSIVLIFGLCVMFMSARALMRGIPAAAVLRLFGMLTIIVMAVFLIVAGYNTEQVAPVVGLLGTLAGYLVGRSASSEIAEKAKAAVATAASDAFARPETPTVPVASR